MATIDKPLFRPEAIRPHLKTFMPSPQALAGRGKLIGWAAKLGSRKLDDKKETELLPEFLSDVFSGVLGYVGQPAEPFTIRREAFVQVDGKFADAGFGRFAGDSSEFVAVLEGKGPRDPLDRPFAGRKRSAVEQALNYAVQLRIDWYLVTNLKEIRLHSKRHDTHSFERFDLSAAATVDDEFRRFVFLLGAENLLATGGPRLNALLAESAAIGKALTDQFYTDYRDLRESLLNQLRRCNPDHDPARLLAATQKILDRVLFTAFCEDRQLLPSGIIRKAFEHRDAFHPRPVWQNFVSLFRAIDRGNGALSIAKYNGGLFADDPFLNDLIVPDDVCERFRKLADYEFGNEYANADAKVIDVEILGHIFEQSIGDLENLRRGLSGVQATEPTRTAPTKRKKDGAFYTPDFITRYIVAETLGPVLAERFEARRSEHEAKATRNVKKTFADPRVFELDKLTSPQKASLIDFWGAWLDELETVRVVDPSCGSGAFLIEAFDQLFREYVRAQGHLTELEGGGRRLFDVQRTILTKNLFGMDLNGEAVEIARLSCWIKTAELGKELTALDGNIQAGNSVVAEPDPLTAWRSRFPSAFADGGFDVVIGNPPYVRQEWISGDKPFLKQHYRAFDGVADLYVYFYELGLKILKPGGRLGYIVTNKWMKAGYGEPLRKLYTEAAWVESVLDLGHNKEIFPDADVFPSILVARKPAAALPPPTETRVCVLPREKFRVDDLSRQAVELGATVPRSRFGAASWNLEPSGVAALMQKIKNNGVPLKEFASTKPFRGVTTGFNDAFIVDDATKVRLIAEHPSSEGILKKFIRGQDINRWYSEWPGDWMIFARRGIDIDQYPAVKRHLEHFRAQLEPKPKDWRSNDWPGRKAGNYHWYEIQDTTDYWELFEQPKIMYGEITWFSSWCLDRQSLYSGNTIYFIPTADLWLLAVANSHVIWWYSWRAAVHGKDEALRYIGSFVESLPIPQPSSQSRAEVERASERLIALQANCLSGTRAVLDWLRVEFGVEKPTQRLAALAELSADGFIAEVKKVRGKKQPLSVADVKRLNEGHADSVAPLQAYLREALVLERRVSTMVNAAYGLTASEVALMWQTAPPRMPISPPQVPAPAT